MPIDTHAHYVPPRLLEMLEDEAARYGVSLVRTPPSCRCALHFEFGLKLRPFPDKLVEPVATRLAAMDRTGIDRQVLSTWADVFAYELPRDHALAWHRKLNVAMAELVRESPERFSFLASLPLPHADAAARELEFAIRELGAVGGVVAANVKDVNLGELPLDEVWSAAQALDAGVLIHPAYPNQSGGQGGRPAKFALAQVVQYTYDTTMTVGSLIGAGVLDRFPRLRLLLCHGGGTFPYLAGRFDIMFRRGDKATTGYVSAAEPSRYLDRFFYDTILHDPRTLEFLADRVGHKQIVIGTDYAFPPADEEPLAMLRQTSLAANVQKAIAEDNPRRLFPQLRDR